MDPNKLKPEFKSKWVAALRSGKYTQAKEKLRSPDGFCCLGVACDLLPDVVSWNPVWEYLNADEDGYDEGDSYIDRYESGRDILWKDDLLPLDVFEAIADLSNDKDNDERCPSVGYTFSVPWNEEVLAKLSAYTIHLPYPHTAGAPATVALDTLNDSGVSFTVIADLIDEYL